MKVRRDINYAMVEETRPPLYTAMKYWGKKPHNIWREYIINYTSDKGIYLDPFAGSAISAFEAVKAGRRAVAFDINPITSFIIESCCSEFNEVDFIAAMVEVVTSLRSDTTYNEYFSTTCRKCGNMKATLQHAKWDSGEIYEVGIICNQCVNKLGRYLDTPNTKDYAKGNDSNIDINSWHPDTEFHNSASFTSSFIKQIGGVTWSKIWTRRNLYVLAYLFNKILKVPNENIKRQLLFAFIQTLHLTSKMCVPRRDGANRAFSTSWGRAAFICANRQMEMNPLLVFKNNCVGKQSVQSCLRNVAGYLGKIPKIECVNSHGKKRSTDYDILYGIVDINKIGMYIEKNSIDFILTDPPYGGLVQYLDLSSVWLVWLEKYNKKYTPNFNAEITIKKKALGLAEYAKRFEQGLQHLRNLLKNNGTIVFTFNNKDLQIWNIFLRSLMSAGFEVEHVIHQQNRRSGESNVRDFCGTSASDFYIRCKKANKKYKPIQKISRPQFEQFVVKKAVEIIQKRNEPTPFQILFNGLLAVLSQAGFDLVNIDCNIEKALSQKIGTKFEIIKDEAGSNRWWLSEIADIKKNVKPLSLKVYDDIQRYIKINSRVSSEDLRRAIFRKYSNGLAPDSKLVNNYIKHYAVDLK